MKLLVRFAPFVSLVLVSALWNWRLGVAAGLLTLIAVTLAVRPRHLGVLGGAMLVFFLGAGLLAIIWPVDAVGTYLRPAAAGWLAIIAAGSALIGRPFTMDFSRSMVGPEVAASNEFLAINRNITLTWAAAFGLVAVSGLAAVGLDRPLAGIGGTVLALAWALRISMKAADPGDPAAATSATGPATIG